MNTLKALEKAPGHLAKYIWGLLGATLDDYALITLTIFVVLLGLLTGSVLIAAATFFGSYFLMLLVTNVAKGIQYHAQTTAQGQAQQAQATMQIAAALAQLKPVDSPGPDSE